MDPVTRRPKTPLGFENGTDHHLVKNNCDRNCIMLCIEWQRQTLLNSRSLVLANFGMILAKDLYISARIRVQLTASGGILQAIDCE
jgi:hypothetical protein